MPTVFKNNKKWFLLVVLILFTGALLFLNQYRAKPLYTAALFAPTSDSRPRAECDSFSGDTAYCWRQSFQQGSFVNYLFEGWGSYQVDAPCADSRPAVTNNGNVTVTSTKCPQKEPNIKEGDGCKAIDKDKYPDEFKKCQTDKATRDKYDAWYRQLLTGESVVVRTQDGREYLVDRNTYNQFVRGDLVIRFDQTGNRLTFDSNPVALSRNNEIIRNSAGEAIIIRPGSGCDAINKTLSDYAVKYADCLKNPDGWDRALAQQYSDRLTSGELKIWTDIATGKQFLVTSANFADLQAKNAIIRIENGVSTVVRNGTAVNGQAPAGTQVVEVESNRQNNATTAQSQKGGVNPAGCAYEYPPAQYPDLYKQCVNNPDQAKYLNQILKIGNDTNAQPNSRLKEITKTVCGFFMGPLCNLIPGLNSKPNTVNSTPTFNPFNQKGNPANQGSNSANPPPTINQVIQQVSGTSNTTTNPTGTQNCVRSGLSGTCTPAR